MPAAPPPAEGPLAAEAIFDVYGQEPAHFAAPPVPGLDVEALRPVVRSEAPERFGYSMLPPAGVPDPAPEVLARLVQATSVHRVRVATPDARDLHHLASAMTVAASLAREIQGVVRDAHTGRVLSFDDLRAIVKAPAFRIRDHVSVHVAEEGQGQLRLHTHGLSKLGRPHVEVSGVPAPFGPLASAALLAVAEYVSRGRGVVPGETVQLGVARLCCVPADAGSEEALRCGLVALADEPGRPGVDRWLAAVAA